MLIDVVSAEEILSVEEVRDYLKLNPDNDEEDTIETYIMAAREYCEMRTGRTIALTEYSVSVESPGKTLIVPRPAILEVTSVTCDGVAIGYTYNYRSITFDIEPQGTVVVNYVSGYRKCPKELRVAMLLLIGHWYAHREAVYVSTGSVTSKSTSVAMGVDAILNQYKVWWF